MEHSYKVDFAQVAKRVKAARKAAGLTQEQLAEKVDISTNAIAKLESNLMATSLQTLVSIANVLRVDLNYFLCGEIQSGDALFDAMIRDLTPRERDFIACVIRDLKKYEENK